MRPVQKRQTAIASKDEKAQKIGSTYANFYKEISVVQSAFVVRFLADNVALCGETSLMAIPFLDTTLPF